jgi:7,8-dihydropterin-6-yl-methyl-4-(beta-D-ribofuranosyl)aminobenzene 5'-phosphate synthase
MRLTVLVDNNAGHNLAGECIEIIGSFHLQELKSDDPKLTGTSRYLKELSPSHVHPCHCTDPPCKMILAETAMVSEVCKN